MLQMCNIMRLFLRHFRKGCSRREAVNLCSFSLRLACSADAGVGGSRREAAALCALVVNTLNRAGRSLAASVPRTHVSVAVPYTHRGFPDPPKHEQALGGTSVQANAVRLGWEGSQAADSGNLPIFFTCLYECYGSPSRFCCGIHETEW